MTLDDLFPELVLSICQYLGHRERKILRLTCRGMSQTLAHDVWCSLKINMTQDNLAEFLRCVSGKAALEPSVLAVKEICFTYPFRFGNDVLVPSDGFEDVLSDEFLGELMRLTNVKKIGFNIFRGYHHIAQRLAKVVSCLNELQNLKLFLDHSPPLPALTHFRNLRTIHYHVLYISDTQKVNGSGLDVVSSAEQLGQVIAQSPNLACLTLKLSGSKGGDLEKLFAPCRVHGNPLRHLYYLNISSCPDSYVPLFPYLRSITNLHISEGSDREYDEKSSLWAALTQQKVSLRYIVLNHIPHGLVEYLKSYRGLKSFRLNQVCNDYPRPGDISDRMAKPFFCEVVPSHASTLVKLVTLCEFENEWCWNSDFQYALLQCKNLEYLCIGITWDQLAHAGGASGPNGERSPIHKLIDGLATECISMQRLCLSSTVPMGTDEYNIGYRQKDMSMWLEESLLAYVSPAGVQSLPRIYENTRGNTSINHFAPVFDEALGRFRYEIEYMFYG
ncbi:hypothetical protein BJ165DRAFT_1518668 [Panaeolus papilionaceus]|nr:hypothetical protein BJ165DRAFT_1518668 [Panaeolus papilionaceus]